ncbi:MAG: MBL fold metallo-hydrolase [Prolixibacteraceae bacterium]|nr:MBL fold metallo-hydrolase [Prolixibacteraceae bacterium]
MKTTILSIVFSLFVIILSAQNRETSPVTLEKISGNVYQLLGGSGANGGVFVGETGVLLIDSKMDEGSVKQSIEAIKKITDKPIKYLVNTHSDGDHIMGNRWFPKTVTFVAQENCRDDFFKVNFGRESDWDEPEFFPYVPSVTFTNDMTLWLGHDEVNLYYFGVGHTTGDCVVYFPKEKIAFVGDQYFSDMPQLIHSNKNGNSFEHVKTLTKMLETIDAEKFCSGHSDIVGRDAVKKHIQSMVDRQKKVKTLMSQGKSMEEVLAEFDENEARLVTSIFNEIKAQ